ncbi:MAG: hypothetical protein MJE68_06400 [Proteobacteria bacterium]|nr:hypothetical protein [Pseudomonadota bacterium]
MLVPAKDGHPKVYYIVLGYANEQKALGGVVDRRGQQNAVFVTPWILPNDSKHNEVSFFEDFDGSSSVVLMRHSDA